MNSLDNLRLSTLGLQNQGMFEKQGTILQSESDAAGANTDLVMNDSLALRQEFCNIVNSIWGLGIYCEVSENVTGLDLNMDGQVQDDQDQSGVQGNAPEGVNE